MRAPFFETQCSYNLVNENNINVISAAAAMFSGIPSPVAVESTVSDFKKQPQVQTSGLG